MGLIKSLGGIRRVRNFGDVPQVPSWIIPDGGTHPTSMTKTEVHDTQTSTVGSPDETYDSGAPANINYYKFVPNVSTTRWVVMLHGDGEDGNADASNLDAALNIGLGKNADAGHVYQFNLLVPQMHNNSWSAWSFGRWIMKHLFDDLGATEVWVTGLSQGGIGACQWIQNGPASADLAAIDFIVPVGGWFAATDYDTFENIPGIAYHGDDDTVVNYGTASGRYQGYNTEWGTPCTDTGDNNGQGADIIVDGLPIELNPTRYDTEWIHSASVHNIWNKVYDPNINAVPHEGSSNNPAEWSQFEIDYAREHGYQLVPQ